MGTTVAGAVATGAAVAGVVLHVLLVVFCVVGPVIVIRRYALTCSRSSANKSNSTRGSTSTSGASSERKKSKMVVIRPLCGLEANLYENLVSCVVQTHGDIHIVFCVATADDPALEVARKVVDDYHSGLLDIFLATTTSGGSRNGNRNRKSTSKSTSTSGASSVIRTFEFFTSESNVGINPKVNNIVQAYNATANVSDYVWIMDANVACDRHTCANALELLQSNPSLGLVHHLPIAVGASDTSEPGSWLEQMFLSTAHARMYTVINSASVDSCLLGKSNMFRRSLLSDVGGIAFFGKYISEDQQIGCHIWEQGYGHQIAGELVYQPLPRGALTLRDYWLRRARWQSIRKYVVPISTLLEPFTESLLNTFVALVSYKYLAATYFPDFYRGVDVYAATKAFLAFQMTMFLLSDVIVYLTLQGKYARSFTRNTLYASSTNNKNSTNSNSNYINAGFLVRSLAFYYTRELLALPIWVYAMVQTQVSWRGKRYHLNTDGTVSPIDDHKL